jgi:polysaccharide biosynthesis protein PslF
MHRHHPSAHPSVAHDGRRFGMLSTFPPTECGIATFAAALSAGIIASNGSVDVVRVGPPPANEDASVVACIAGDPRFGTRAAEDALNRADVVIVQHEFGIYPGADGEGLLTVLDEVIAPMIVVAHTVPADPTPGQRSVLARVCAVADAVVVMTETARHLLVESHHIEPDRVSVIPHGAAMLPFGEPTSAPRALHTPRLLTWGLLGPGKGIEWAIDAMGLIGDLTPAPHYLVAGATHPKVLERSGEAYRTMLEQRAEASTSRSMVSFDATYRDLPSLNALIASADIVVLPYDSAEQVTSGVLVDAVAAGKPVVSTAFPHAVELLSGGAGIVVPQRDPVALAAAICEVIADPDRLEAMGLAARRLAPDLSWTAVATQYIDLAEDLIADTRSVRS